MHLFLFLLFVDVSVFCNINPRAIKLYLKPYHAITFKKAPSAGNSNINCSVWGIEFQRNSNKYL